MSNNLIIDEGYLRKTAAN
jgi:hypothetical protein